jgi:hypothetical protein
MVNETNFASFIYYYAKKIIIFFVDEGIYSV